MREPVVIAGVIVAVAIMAATSLWIYFSPYHSCVRGLSEAPPDAFAEFPDAEPHAAEKKNYDRRQHATRACAALTGRGR